MVSSFVLLDSACKTIGLLLYEILMFFLRFTYQLVDRVGSLRRRRKGFRELRRRAVDGLMRSGRMVMKEVEGDGDEEENSKDRN